MYQTSAFLPRFGTDYRLINSWIIGDDPADIGIRQYNYLITKNIFLTVICLNDYICINNNGTFYLKEYSCLFSIEVTKLSLGYN
nr:glutathionylspermidine synthase family protein [Providencia sneebia]